MKQTVNFAMFRDAFKDMGRINQFSYEALEILFDHFEESEQDMDTEIELDVIAICCKYTESDAFEVIQSYGLDISHVDVDHNEQLQILAREYLDQEGVLIGETPDGSFVYRQF